ncbi:ParB/RepB/Spo0J family partition protein [Novosphingobium taihuense]|uniref:ParB family chromosome partitioning protein n=1 Tax=Novosphingobium taihuense TaxID=260085 RepID=A0A7W7EWS6_9SPHN|nr:ParB/RepB/Spo0J family partition protein [Novosphingobium taihuense]MBB4614615.1 ParB family chromosome partitioning protein [Novosphingobium taihuense]TWH86143.1 ParB family chromosome partitioning protein [Novosphingobium taihuense]
MSGDEAVKAPARRTGLGRGLGALMGEVRREEPIARISVSGEEGAASRDGGLALLMVASIEPHPDQPRRHFDEDALEELAQSIAARGVIQPVVVRPIAGGRYQLVAGERRWRAAQKAQVHEIPAIVRKLDDRDVAALALIENLQREDLNPVEEARAYQRLADSEGLTQNDIAKFVDKSRSHVANMMRLLGLPDDVLDMVVRSELSMGHARALINAPDPVSLAREVIAKDLSVRDTEKLARKATRPEGQRRQARAGKDSVGAADLAAIEQHLEDFLGLKVSIQPDSDPTTGAVTIRYKNLDQLDLICGRLTGGDF